jgi:hypothetical protein
MRSRLTQSTHAPADPINPLDFVNGRMAESCVICLEPLSVKTGIIDCGHRFCLPCIQKWCENDSTCPICRVGISKIRLFYRSFFMGDEIAVTKKEQKISIPEDDFVTDDDDPQIPENSVPNPFAGTGWNSGHRVSLRERRQHNSEAFAAFRLELLLSKCERLGNAGLRPSQLDEDAIAVYMSSERRRADLVGRERPTANRRV